MKQIATIIDAENSLQTAVSTLHKHFGTIEETASEQVKLANEYYKWTALKTDLILDEKTFQLPPAVLPNTIKPSSFQWLRPEKQAIVSKYYLYNADTDRYVISTKKQNVPQADIDMIARSLVLIRKSVVWVDFGYNIGTEFGGRHPAIILKNLKDSLVVIPLYSHEPKSMDYNVKVDKVYGYPLMPRWVNVTRITQVSLSRVHFEKIGDVKPSVLTQISEKLRKCGITG